MSFATALSVVNCTTWLGLKKTCKFLFQNLFQLATPAQKETEKIKYAASQTLL